MKKTLIIIVCVLAVALAMLLAALGILHSQEKPPVNTQPTETTVPTQTTTPTQTTAEPTQTTADLSGWEENDDGTMSYRDEQGQLLTGWQTIDGNTYRFTDEGIMVTGWLDGNHFGDDGVQTFGWLDTDDGRLYLGEDGLVATGWIETETGKYWLDEEGHPTTGWMMTENLRLYFDETGLMATGFVEVDGVERYFTSDGNYVPLVNPWNEVPEDYSLNLLELEGFEVDFTCRDALAKMLIDCREGGLSCPLNSTYRSIEIQTYLWNNRYNNYIADGYSPEEAKKLTWQKVAYPGTSEHHLGLAVDIIGSDEMYDWFYQHSWEYGFIVRYPEDKIDVTGIMYEPWHFRYVGKEMAQQVYESGLTLEEYLDVLRNENQKETGE